jgi:hypothetical protein
MHEINFHIHQTYNSLGWVDPTQLDPAGQYVRAIEFNLSKFKQGSFQHQIKTKSRSDKLSVFSDSSEGQAPQNIEITVSGVLEGTNNIAGGAVGQRVEFVFALPPHLSMKQV